MFTLDQISQWIIAVTGTLLSSIAVFGVRHMMGIGKCIRRIDISMAQFLEREQAHVEKHDRLEETVKENGLDIRDHAERLRVLEFQKH